MASKREPSKKTSPSVQELNLPSIYIMLADAPLVKASHMAKDKATEKSFWRESIIDKWFPYMMYFLSEVNV